MDAKTHAKYILNFIKTFFDNEHEHIAIRELECLKAKLPFCFGEVEQGDVIVGRYVKLAVGFSPQEASDMGYFLDEELLSSVINNVDKALGERLRQNAERFRQYISSNIVRKKYDDEMLTIVPDDDKYEKVNGEAFFLYRMSGTHPNYKALIRHGVNGLKEKINGFFEKDNQNKLYIAMLGALDVFSATCKLYEERARAKNLHLAANALCSIRYNPAKNMREALTMVHLYSLLCGSLNYGRMDDYLADFAFDLDADEVIEGFFKAITIRGYTFDGRVVVGGKNRENEANADIVALKAISAAERFRSPLPQLTLRFYDKQNPALKKAAFDNFEKGCIYPMLYNDEVNIPAVKEAFGFNEEIANDYMPFGCGEYVINHYSVGTPSGLINLLEILIRVLKTREFDSFEELLTEYKARVERVVRVLARQEAYEYQVAGETAAYLMLSILFDGCIEKGKGIFNGGVMHLGGTLESYGNINTADSLTAIKTLIFDEKRISQKELLTALDNNFEGSLTLRKMLLDCAKFGNDDEAADSMARLVHEHICNYTKEQAKINGLDSYLVVVINNNANSVLGSFTSASADGRLAGEPMANANNPQGGADKNGLTAMLNSLIKLDNKIHAGAVQNLKVSKKLVNEHRKEFEALLEAYFKKGQQLMLNILSKGDLEDALVNPLKHKNIIVRVGGFSARFIDLDEKTQREVLLRTLY